MRDTHAGLFETHRVPVADGDVDLAYVREGVGGIPLVCLHGWPGSKRLWWRNIEPLAEAGFEVIVPDLRGIGESSVPRRGHVDVASCVEDVRELLTALGHEQAVFAAGDRGSTVLLDIASTYPGTVMRQVLFNGTAPAAADLYAAAGIEPANMVDEVVRVTAHMESHSLHADELAASLATPDARVEYVMGFLTDRRWREGDEPRHLAGPGAFSEAQAMFQAESYGDAERFRASLELYEGSVRPLTRIENRTGDRSLRTMIIYGTLDQIIPSSFATRNSAFYENVNGPHYLSHSGHFVQWEAAAEFNALVAEFCRDLLSASGDTRR